MLILMGSFILFLVMKMPVGFSMFSSSVLYMAFHQEAFELAAQRLAAGPDSFPLLAVAFFVLAGNIMNSGGITRRLFKFAEHVVGHLTGGLAHANVLAGVILSGMSGSAVADAVGLGAIELKAMREAGYDDDFILGVTGASAIIGPIIPPSIPAVIFGVAGGVSVGRLFAGGFIPGLLMAGATSTWIYFVCRKREYAKGKKRAPLHEIYKAFKQAFFALLTPVIIMGGIIGGVFTPTEAAIVAVFYGLLLGFVYREITLKDLPRFLKEAIQTTIGILFIIGCATLFGWIFTISQVPQKLTVSFLSIVTNKYVALLLIDIFLLIVGCFMDPTAAILILVPILLPITTSLGIDPVHFGIVMILNLMIGLLTPPVGFVLYVLSTISGNSFEKVSKAVLPFVALITGVLFVITYVPSLVTFVPNLIFK
jgi:TRAP-type transport system large permease protein